MEGCVSTADTIRLEGFAITAKRATTRTLQRISQTEESADVSEFWKSFCIDAVKVRRYASLLTCSKFSIRKDEWKSDSENRHKPAGVPQTLFQTSQQFRSQELEKFIRNVARITNQHNDKLPVSLLAQLEEHCTDIALSPFPHTGPLWKPTEPAYNERWLS